MRDRMERVVRTPRTARRRGAARAKGLRFWQKAYLLTLALFLVTLFGGVALMGWQNQQQTLDREVENARSEQRFIAQSLARDLATIEASNVRLHASSLIRSYGEHYAQDGALLDVRRGDETVVSTIPSASEDEPPLSAAQGEQTWSVLTLADGKRYLLVASFLDGGADGYALVYARSLEALMDAWGQMRATLVVGCILASTVLAAALFFILRGLSKPLEQLAGVADEFAAGDLGARAAKRSDDEIGMLADSFNAMADTAERDIAEIQRIADQNARMSANLSHEIRTPLTAIRGYAEYLRLADPSPDERESALSCIVSESERLQAVAQRMLALATLENDEIELRPCNLAEIAEQACRSILPAAQKAGVSLKLDAAAEARVMGDAVLLVSLATNLVNNAVRACDGGGAVVVSTAADGGAVALRVSDNGRGLAPDELARLGEPFFRPDKARSRAAGGAGLGVALCFQIARLHEAKLSYTSRPGVGTVATLEFTGS